MGAVDDLVVRLRAAHPGQAEAVAELDALDGLDAHEGVGDLGVQAGVALAHRAEPGRAAPGEHLDDAAERVAVLLAGRDLGLHDP